MNDDPKNAPEEVRRLQGQAELDKTGSNEVRRNPEQIEGKTHRDDDDAGKGTAEDINKQFLPDDSEQYAHEDNAEARDSRRPYEDSRQPESHDASIQEGIQRMPDEDPGQK